MLTVGPRWWEGPQAAAIFASVSVPLPLQNRNQGAVRQAQAMVEKAAGERKAAEVMLIKEAGESYEQMVKAHTEIQILSSSSSPTPSAPRTPYKRATQLESSVLWTSSKHAARLSRRAHSICKLL